MKKIMILLFMVVSPVFAAEDFYQFTNATQQQRFEALTINLRCLVCQNQNIAESNAALASDLRGQIYKQIQDGQTDKQILDYLVARYSHFILYQPPFNMKTIGLWLAPFLFLILGVSYLFYYVTKRE